MVEKTFPSMKNGKEKQLETLLPKLYAYCTFLTKDKWLGEDLAHDAVVKAFKTYGGEITPALLKKIAYHGWIDHMRKAEKETLVSDEGFEGQATEKSDVDPEILEKLLTLTAKQLVTFVLKEAFQYKISEIAELLEMSETGVKALLNRARSRVQKVADADEQNAYDEVLYRSLVKAIAIQDPATFIKLIPTLIPRASRLSSPSMILSLAA